MLKINFLPTVVFNISTGYFYRKLLDSNDLLEPLSLSEMERSIGAFLKGKMDQNISSIISHGCILKFIYSEEATNQCLMH